MVVGEVLGWYLGEGVRVADSETVAARRGEVGDGCFHTDWLETW